MNQNGSGNLQSKAMLAKLMIKQWGNHKHDRDVTLEVARTHSITTDAGRYNKVLIGKSALAEIKRIVGIARQTHYKLTLPWTDDGSRILPARMFQKYTQETRTIKSKFEKSVEEFVSRFPGYLTEASATLGDLFKSKDYPDPAGIGLFFAFGIEISPIPSGEDFRVSIGDDDRQVIQEEIESKVSQAGETARLALWTRLRDLVSHAAERLTVYQTTADGKVENPFRDSLIGNVQELIAILPDLNVADDPDLADISREVASMIDHSPQALREDILLRTETAKKAEDISRKMAGFMGGN